MNLPRILLGAAIGGLFGAFLAQDARAQSLRRRRARAVARGARKQLTVDTPGPVQWAVIGGVIAGVTAPTLPPPGDQS